MASDPGGLVLIIDRFRLRLSALQAFLEGWARDQKVEIQGVDFDAAWDLLESGRDVRLAVLQIGSDSLASRTVQQQLRLLRSIDVSVPVVVVSDRDDAGEVIAALAVGVQGFLPTSLDPKLAKRALGFVLGGGSFFPAKIVAATAHAPEQDDGTSSPEAGGEAASGGARLPSSTEGTRARPMSEPDGPDGGEEASASGHSMTPRQLEVLKLLCRGDPNKIIARRLGMTEATVKVHVRQIMRKLGATNRTQAALCAVDADLPIDVVMHETGTTDFRLAS